MRFVLLEHTPGEAPAAGADWGAGLHFDLMLEVDAEGPLATWRLAADPFFERRGRAAALADHRRAFLEYEGPLTGGRGSVRRVASGEAGLFERKSDELRVILKGESRVIRLDIADGEFASREVGPSGTA